MAPTTDTLNRYISHERRDYRARVAAVALGEVRLRTLPTIDKEAVLVVNQLSPFTRQSRAWPKQWSMRTSI